MLERQRLGCVTRALTHLAAVMDQWIPEEREIIQSLCSSSSAMNAEADILSLVQGCLHLHGPAPSPTVYSYMLPCSLTDIKAGKYEGNPNSQFHTSVQRAMELQPSVCDGLRVPRVLTECVAAVRRNDGLANEGIFRLSPSKYQFDEAKVAVDAGDYNALTRYDAYVSASLLKDWLRSLSEPIIPDALYEEAVAVAQADMVMGSGGGNGAGGAVAGGLGGAQAVFGKLDAVSQDVLRVIGRLVQDATAGKYEANLMSYESLSIVFAPCFLRCSMMDPTVVFANTRFEVRFTLLLLQSLKSPTQ